MTTALITHSACFAHDPPAGHPERPARLRAVLDSLSAFDLQRIESPRADTESLSRVHDAALVSAVLSFRGPDFTRIDPDTFMSAGSAEAALHAAGAVIAAVDGVMGGNFRNAFCAVRPPGHHAERARAMGFCLFNNVAVGALQARAVHGLTRIAVVDFDVHHGNGTQDIFSADPDLFYASTHQMPLYPGTGFAAERGVADNVLNKPLPPGSGSAEFREVYRDSVFRCP
jgi:acetoin utilization deacetylase AcuC-like enzyme